MTETVMNLGNPLAGTRKAGSVGLPFTGVEVRVVSPVTGEKVKDGTTGELQLRGPNVFKGYWQQQEATREAFTPDGWFKTGDLGYRDAAGYTYLSGRAKELIISGGFNVYPREVEEVLEAHDGVAEAAVFGLPDPDLGERVAAAVVAEDAALEAGALQRYCKERLASFKGPKEIYFVKELPRNALGKVQKHVLRELLKHSMGDL
jgi:malonyl-CoA/methylmalonyl-CoA synthetase